MKEHLMLELLAIKRSQYVDSSFKLPGGDVYIHGTPEINELVKLANLSASNCDFASL